MTRLINFGTGEICDRLAILALKILHAQRSGHNVGHFQTEQAELLILIRDRPFVGDVWRGMFALAAVNGALWTAEDQMRVLRGRTRGVTFGGPEDAVELCAFVIQDLNDRRSALVEGINRVTGEHDGSEKTPPG